MRIIWRKKRDIKQENRNAVSKILLKGNKQAAAYKYVKYKKQQSSNITMEETEAAIKKK